MATGPRSGDRRLDPGGVSGHWCQESTKDNIFKPGGCKLKIGSLSIDRMTLDAGRLSCGFDSGTASDGTLQMRMLCTDPEDKESLNRHQGTQRPQRLRCQPRPQPPQTLVTLLVCSALCESASPFAGAAEAPKGPTKHALAATTTAITR